MRFNVVGGMNLVKVLYVGDYSLEVMLELKGVELLALGNSSFDLSKHLKEALEKEGIEVEHMPAYKAYKYFPESLDDLKRYDVLILSDIGSDTLLLYPGERRFKVPMGVNRIKLIVKYVNEGGGLIFCGGWFSFQGFRSYGNWLNTPLAKILPVEILNTPDDRVETPEGAKPIPIDRDHPINRGLEWESCPPFLGYNKVKRGRGKVLVELGEEKDPLVVVGEHGKGRILVFTSDPAPHWGSGFVTWKHYSRFWSQAVRWVARSEDLT